MARNDVLTAGQLALLRRIAGGDDLSGPDGITARTSARALQRRHLVDVTRKGGNWRAQVTADGEYFLEHGRRPEPAPQKAKPRPILSRAKKPGPDPEDDARRLIERLEVDGGTIRLPNPSADERASYRRLLNLCKQAGLVPDGAELLHTGRDKGDMIIRLSRGAEGDSTDWNRIRLSTRQTMTDPDALANALAERPHCLKITDASTARAIKLIVALAKAAITAGYSVGINIKPKTPKLFLQAGDVRRALLLEEEYDQVRHKTTEADRQALRGRFWTPPPTYDTVPSGRLKLQIGRAGWDVYDSWVDEKGNRLEKRLPQILDDVRRALAEDEKARVAAAKQAEEARENRRQEKIEERARWEKAIETARIQATDRYRRQTFRWAYDRWVAAAEIRAFCTALEAESDPDKIDSNVARWIAWARRSADHLDPASSRWVWEWLDFDRPPGPDDLRPFLGDWSPHEPVREYYRPRTADSTEKHPPNWWDTGRSSS